MELKNRFEQFTSPGYYSRVDNEHILELYIGLSEALRSWSGQELTHKDFSYDDTWTEVKTIRRSSQTVRISSLEQLDSKDYGELAVYALEKMSPEYKGITSNRLIVDIRNLFDDSDDRDSFMAKVALQGYEYHNYYDDFVFEKIYFKSFRITEGFPRLVPSNMPDGVIEAAYDIDLNKLNEFENRL